MLGPLLLVKGFIAPVAVVAALGFAWSIKTSFESGAAAKVELALQGRYRAAQDAEASQARNSLAKRHEAVTERQGAIELDLRRELDALKARRAEVHDKHCGW